MSDAPLKLTVAEMEAARSPQGGWTRKQLATWGVKWPPPRGWRQALLHGRPIPDYPGDKRVSDHIGRDERNFRAGYAAAGGTGDVYAAWLQYRNEAP